MTYRMALQAMVWMGLPRVLVGMSGLYDSSIVVPCFDRFEWVAVPQCYHRPSHTELREKVGPAYCWVCKGHRALHQFFRWTGRRCFALQVLRQAPFWPKTVEPLTTTRSCALDLLDYPRLLV